MALSHNECQGKDRNEITICTINVYIAIKVQGQDLFEIRSAQYRSVSVVDENILFLNSNMSSNMVLYYYYP